MSIKEENLIQYSGTIKAGQRLVKVGNTFMPVGIGGAFEPGSGGDGSNNMKFYKCASVDAASKTWSGYELVLTDGKYSVSDVVMKGLSYSGFEPLVGRIYSADGMLEVSSFYEGFHLVSPIDMTSNENDEWVITASSYRFAPYNAFSGSDTETFGWESGDYESFPHWIQWQNKQRKATINEYSLQVNNHTDDFNRERFPGSWILQGSDDGSSWVTVDDRTDAITDYTQLETLKYYNFTCQNPGSYNYYRIYITKSADGVTGGGYTYIGQIKAYGNFE